uniref:Glucanase n=1 Tax=Anaeromyces sp. W-98 TaxID=191512 RepID=Q6A4K7_9FUNG|nr:cellulase [Anaeromyces sp. W-98]
MKFTTLLTALFATGTMASVCHPYYPCCNGCDVRYVDEEGNWGIEGDWCFINESKCNGGGSCKFEALGYQCCKNCNNVVLTDNDGAWGIENHEWCGIDYSRCNGHHPQRTTTTTTRRTTTTTTPAQSRPTSDNFFENTLYSNYKFQQEVDTSIAKLSGQLQEKAKKVKYIPTAAWLAWDGAPNEVPRYLQEAGSDTVVFVLYMIPNRDCGAVSSRGGADSIDKYKGYVDKIYNTINQYPNSRIVMILEPDTLGNMVTNNNGICNQLHDVYKQSLSYRWLVKFGTPKVTVRVSLDCCPPVVWLTNYRRWLLKLLRKLLVNLVMVRFVVLLLTFSNYQSVDNEYRYQQNLNSALERNGVYGMKFLVDTSRNGRGSSGTWCNFNGAGLGARPQANPANYPLLDAFVWIKTPGESDGNADDNCRSYDSFQNAPAAGSWFHDYFVMLLQNANPSI